MVGPMFYFFDVPVYRLTKDRYYAEQKEHIDQTMYSDQLQRQFYENNRDNAIRFEAYLQHAYGGCWDYNEIIGYIRMHFLGTQIRGEYFGVKAKRIVRTRRKTLEYRAYKLAPEVSVPANASSVKIYKLIQKYLNDCQRELRGRHIDTQMLDALAPYIDWRQMFYRSLRR
jgi:hypothetical protein